MKIEDLIRLLDNRLREFKLSRDYATMSGDLEQVVEAEKEILSLEDTLFKLKLLIDASESNTVKEATLAEIMADGSVAVLGEYDITPYATDPLHEEKVMNILSKMGLMDTAEQIDKYIKRKYAGSPVTGEMVMSAAEAYDVDARLMMAIMEQDSRFGTAGKAIRTLNPGNVGNDDAGNLRTYDSWQEGVTAVAEWLNRHRTSKITSEIPEETTLEPTATSTPPVITPDTTSTTTTTTTWTTITATSTPPTLTPPTATSTPSTLTPTSTPSTSTTTPPTSTSTPSTTTTSTSTPPTLTPTPTTATSTPSTTTPPTSTSTPSTTTSTSTPPIATSTPPTTTSTSATDATPPVITINGNNPAHVDVGTTYADLGARVEDNVAQNLGIHTFMNGVEVVSVNLDTSTDATHEIMYRATDQAGNVGEATRTVIVGTGIPEESTEPPVEEESIVEETTPGPETATTTPETTEGETIGEETVEEESHPQEEVPAEEEVTAEEPEAPPATEETPVAEETSVAADTVAN